MRSKLRKHVILVLRMESYEFSFKSTVHLSDVLQIHIRINNNIFLFSQDTTISQVDEIL